MVEVVLTSKDDALVKLLTDEVGHLTAERDEALNRWAAEQQRRDIAESKLRRIRTITQEAP